MMIAIAGVSGFIGTALSGFLEQKGYRVIPIERRIVAGGCTALAEIVRDADVVINLAGAPVFGRWTKSRKRELYDSRIQTTRNLINAMNSLQEPPALFMSGSAIGIYDSSGYHTEEKYVYAEDYLGKICKDWEHAANGLSGKTRVVLLRTSVVLDPKAGALRKMFPLFKFGIGGVIASGKQGFSWIHLEDYLNALEFIMTHKDISGPVNLSAPDPVDNRELTMMLGKVLKRPTFMHVPEFALKLIFLEGASSLTSGQFVLPDKLKRSGFSFQYADLESTLKNLLHK
jgi:uncharacterized protein